MGTPAPDAVKRLIDPFDQYRKVSLSGDYKEQQLPVAMTPLEVDGLRPTTRDPNEDEVLVVECVASSPSPMTTFLALR